MLDFDSVAVKLSLLACFCCTHKTSCSFCAVCSELLMLVQNHSHCEFGVCVMAENILKGCDYNSKWCIYSRKKNPTGKALLLYPCPFEGSQWLKLIQ